MFTFAITFCLIFQSAVAIYLLKSVHKVEIFDWQLRNVLIVLLTHILIKFILFFVIKSNYPYGTVATGFSFFYAPYFFIITRKILLQPVSKRVVSIHLLPFYIFSFAFVLLIFFHWKQVINSEQMIVYNNVNLTATTLSFTVYGSVIKKQFKKIKQDSSDVNQTLQKQLINNSISIMLMCGGMIVLFKMLHFIYPRLIDVDIRSIIYLHLLLLPILAIRYKLKSGSQETTFINVASHEQNELQTGIVEVVKKYQKSGIEEADLIKYEDKIVKYMKKSKPYLNAELSLEDLAKQTGIPKHHLTQTLNNKIEKSFYQFINEYRIEEAKQKLKNEKEEVSMLSLAFDVGFNSKSSFNNNFKKLTGHTPSSYKKFGLVAKE